MSEDAGGEALERFISASSAAEREASFSHLVKRKKHQAAWKIPEFQTSVTELIGKASEPSTDELELLANLAVIARVYSAVKNSRKAIAVACESSLKEAPPALTLLRNPDDRLAVATLLQELGSDWVEDYAARAIVYEDSAEKTREQLTAVLVTRLDLSSVLAKLTSHLERLDIGTENPADAMGRRLRRIIVSLRRRLPMYDVEAGVDVGTALQDFLGRPFLSSGDPQDDKVVRELADEALGLVHDIVRTQLALAADPDVYNATSIPKRWIARGLWPRFVQRSKNGAAVVQDLRGAILLLGRQGITSSALRDRLVELSGSSDSAGSILKGLAAMHPELSPDIRRWLEAGGRGGFGNPGGSPQLTEAFGADDYVAQALLAATQVRSAIAGGAVEAAGNLLVDGREAPALVMALIQDVERLAGSRGLRLRGQPGEIVQYAPHAHRVAGDAGEGVTRVRILKPIVERTTPAGAVMVVVRALVEPA